MKPFRWTRPSAWNLTPKLLAAFLLVAVLPVLAASLFSLNYFYRVSFEGAQKNLTRELDTARLLWSDWERRLESDTRAAARENLVTLNLSLGLTAPVLDYLETQRLGRRLTLMELRDAGGILLGRSAADPASLPADLDEGLLARARSLGGLTFPLTLQDGRILLMALVPVTDDRGVASHYLLAGIDPGAGEHGGILDTIGQVVSGPVVLAGSRGLLGVSPGSPPWEPGFRWPAGLPAAGELLPAAAGGTTYLFGFTAVGPTGDGPTAWVGVSFSLDGFRQVTDAAAGGLILIAAVFLLLSCLAAVGFSRRLTRPLLKMAGQAGAWTGGQGGQRLEITSQDETGILGRAFNEVLDRLDGTLYSLRKTQNYLKNIFNSLTSVLISVDETGTVQEWNVAAERFNGTKAAEAQGRKVWDLSPVFQGLEPLLDRAVATREPQFAKKDLGRAQEKRSFDLCFYPLVWNGVSGAVIRMDDITDSLKKDRQLRQAQKMETVGTLTGGIAHNFNNLLTGITGAVSLVELDLSEGDRVDPDLIRVRMAMILDSTRKASQIVRQLMGLTRGGGGEFGPQDLGQVVREVVQTARLVLDPSVEVEAPGIPAAAPVYGDRSQLEQCLLNLIINASHAMTLMRPRGEHRGGTVLVSLKTITAVNDFLATHPGAVQSDYWLMQIKDSGVGISPENLALIFDPFFTTKDMDTGSGLGLAMVYASVRQHNGFIDVYSEVGRGTTVSLYLPVLRDPAAAVPAPLHRGTPVRHRGQGLILVVDDEPVVLNTAQMILQACGYRVVTAANGLEALEVYRSRGREIRAVVLDSSMPKLSGAETIEALRKVDPGVRVVLSSGLFDPGRLQEVSDGGLVRFLPKPYSLDGLSQVLHDLLEETS